MRIRNTWFFDWQSAFPATGMKIGIAPASRAALAAQGVAVLDGWATREQQAFGQVVDAGFVRVPDLKVGEETTVYFKLDVGDANPSKPEIGFVAQRDAFDPHYDAPTRVARRQVFISRSSFDRTTKELVCEIPEGTLRLKFTAITLDLKAADDAAKDLMACLAAAAAPRRTRELAGRLQGRRRASCAGCWRRSSPARRPTRAG